MNDKTNELTRLKAALYSLREIFPYFGYIASELRIVTPTTEQLFFMRANEGLACISPKGVMTFNPELTIALSQEQLMTLLAHEGMHLALNIFQRSIGLDLKITNWAHDYLINDMLVIAHLPAIDGWLHNKKFRKMSFEQTYNILAKDDTGKKKKYCPIGKATLSECSLNDALNQSLEESVFENEDKSVGDSPYESHEDYLDRIKCAIKAAHKADLETPNPLRGSVPSDLWKVFDEEVIEPKMSFEELLNPFFGRYGRRNKLSFTKRNRRNSYQNNQPYLPGKKQHLPKVCLLIDTSASMGCGEGTTILAKCLGTAIKLSTNYQLPIDIFMADSDEPTQMTSTEVQEAIKSKKLNLLGGGGSNFKPAFNTITKHVLQENPTGCPIIVYTDGDIAVPKTPPNSIANATIWVTPKGNNPPAQWGTSLDLS